ncbi:hypothetical protein ACIBG5_00490 [Kribbella sp. NPDC050241]|uniref:hypothetical protein n=1 Tax=Kribbella sp. NPDC050241 TaxID=3364115 RepID=UPI003799FCC9
MSKFLGFLLGVAVALAGPAVFGVLAAPGGIELNVKEMALAYGIGALIFWTVVSYFSGAGALGAFIAFGTLIYCWLWIPNRTTNFLNDVPGVTNGMIDGSKQYTLNGVVPILAVISLVYGIQLIVQSTQRRRRERAEAERLQQEQEAVQAQQEADAAALYPVAGSTYPGQYAETYESRSRFDDLFDEDPEPVRPRSQADEQTAQFPAAGTAENTAQFRGMNNDAEGNEFGDDTELVPTDRDETTQVPTAEPQQEKQPEAEPRVAEASEQPMAEDEQVTQVPMSAGAAAAGAAEQETQQVPVRETEQPTQQAPVSEQQETQQVRAAQQAEREARPEEPSPQAPSGQTAGTQEAAAPQTPSEQQAGTQEAAAPQTPSEQPAGTQEAAGTRDAGGSTAASGGAAAASGGESEAAAPVDEAEQETQQVPVQTAQQAEPEARPEEPKPAGPQAPSGPAAGGPAAGAAAAGAAAAGAAGASGGQLGTAQPVVKSGGQASAPEAGGEESKPTGPSAPSAQAAAPQAPSGQAAAPQAPSGQAAAPQAPGAESMGSGGADSSQGEVGESRGAAAGGQAERRGERVGTPPVPEVREQGVAPVPGVREQVGSQYRERMDDPEDTGEFFISAFENPPVIDGPGQIRAAGA